MEESGKHYPKNITSILGLNANKYCDLGVGHGTIALALKEAGRHVMGVEHPAVPKAEWAWAEANGVELFFSDFFGEEMKNLPEDIDCFYQVHSIAHFRFPPHELLQVCYDKLPIGGKYYLSTVNASSLVNVMRLFRGQPVTGQVNRSSSWAPKGEVSLKSAWNDSGRHQIWDDWMHVKEYTLPELVQIFEDVGFKVVEARHQNFHSHWKKSLACALWPQAVRRQPKLKIPLQSLDWQGDSFF
jgi:SAM-dependent methyltransferase